MYGTLLNEFRNGTGPCVKYNVMDKDFDIAVFETNFHDVVALKDEIHSLFGWKVGLLQEDQLIMVFFSPNQTQLAQGFQVDVYGFKTDHPRKGLIHFPWDRVTVATDAFLPLVKHKPIAQNYTNRDESLQLHFYMPFNPKCLLTNLYGSDFMTPKNREEGKFHRRAFDDPKCDGNITAY